MGSGIIRKITEQDDMEVVAAIEMPNTPLAGTDAGERAGVGKLGVPIVGSEDLEKALKESGAEVLVDFTIAPAAVETIKRAVDCGVNLVVGTTGFTEEQAQGNADVIKEKNIKAVISSNFSIGVNVFFKVLKDLTPILNDFDIEIIEAHHNQKADAPSGTAMMLAKAVCEAKNWDEDVIRHGREGVIGARPRKEIGMHSLRGGDVVGDHTVMFAMNGERIELTHKASSRDMFSNGALRAVRFLSSAAPGLYDMQDVLNLK